MRVIEQAQQEERRAPSRGNAVAGHGVEYLARIPDIHQFERARREERAQGGGKPHDVTDGRRGQRCRRSHDRWRRCVLAQERRPGALIGQVGAMGVDDTLGCCRGPRGVADERRAVRVNESRLIERIGIPGDGLRPRQDVRADVRQRPSVGRDDDDRLEVGETCDRGLEIGQVVLPAEPVGRDEGAGSALPQDVTDLLGPVDVHDGDHHDAQWEKPVEAGDRLGPVGQLEGDDIACDDALTTQGHGESATEIPHLTDGAVEGSGPGAHPAPHRRGPHHAAKGDVGQGVVVPPPHVRVVTGEVGPGRPKTPLGSAAHRASNRGGRRSLAARTPSARSNVDASDSCTAASRSVAARKRSARPARMV